MMPFGEQPLSNQRRINKGIAEWNSKLNHENGQLKSQVWKWKLRAVELAMFGIAVGLLIGINL